MIKEMTFRQGAPFPAEENRLIEFKEIRGSNHFRPILDVSDEYAVAFLNSDGGRIYWGIRDTDKVVVGVHLGEADRDRLRRDVTSKLAEIQPQIDPTRFKLELYPVVGGSEDLFVVELSVPAGNSPTPYFTASHTCFVRVDGVKRKLSGQQLTDWILSRAVKNSVTSNDDSVDPTLIALAQRVRRIFSVLPVF